MPILDTDRATLHHGDSLAILRTLPDCSVDTVLTDPPYSSGGMTMGARQADPAKKYQQTRTKRSYPAMIGDNRDQRSFTLWASLWLAECWRVAVPGARLMVFTDWRQLPAMTDAVQAAGWMWRGLVVWHKPSARPVLGDFKRDAEFVVTASKGKPGTFSRRCLPGVYRHNVNAARKIHLTEKPVPLLVDLLEATKPGGVVLDPFAGSGSTGEACLSTGRRYIGIELSQEYTALAADRLQKVMAA
ncbi:DNA methylase N-4/N-6 domain protein [Desulfovibrio sp. X2]|uniref:DNA-methyltransferase n=1 Tax=Desulfovibrio sp. X2 TaxID=941449 RepID=UPI0003587560|nr:site-specific DNA-methyltransferase [Desulfovibrio sp. X2]EPR43154.1 DNA methylase N-4/N-6 domain protein [Desulfovibrio sp. X2]